MHILIASPYLPWPLVEGGRVAQYRTFEAMRDVCTFTLVAPVRGAHGMADARSFAKMFPNVRVEAIPSGDSYGSPRPALAHRAADKLLRRISPPKPLEMAPWYPFERLSPHYVTALERQLAQGCDILQAEFAEMLSLGPFVTGRAPSIFVHHQLHFVYARRYLEANGEGGAYAQYVTQRMIQEEAAYLNTFDSVIVFSDVDRGVLKNFCPTLDVSVSPFPSPEDPAPTAIPFDKPATRFVFVASESHRPNYEGLRWFMKEVWPAVKSALPDSSMDVIGKWSHAAQTSLPNYEDISFSGFVPDLRKSLQNKIMIVPVWVGSGIRTKILAAWSASCPVITTTIGVEGLPGQSGDHFIIADEASAFARVCVELSQNVSKLNRIAANGLDLVQKRYSLEAVRKTRLDVYEKLLAARPKAV
jgi:glycosyltransferase involved in cell wall biosynthesis